MAFLRMIWILLLLFVVLGFGLCGGYGVLGGVATLFGAGDLGSRVGAAVMFTCLGMVGLGIAWGAWMLVRHAFGSTR